jgi:hypothetical protein
VPYHDMKAGRVTLVLLLSPCLVKADLGIVRSREAQGPFMITLFTSSELVQGQATDVSVLVQGRDSNEVILDAVVGLILKPPGGSIPGRAEPMCGQPTMSTLGAVLEAPNREVLLNARREHSLNKLLYAAPVNFPQAGPWNLETLVQHGSDSAKLTCEIVVDLPPRRLTGLVPYLLSPLLLVVLFIINQWLRAQRSTE